MRRRHHQRGASILAISLVLSAGIHALLISPLRSLSRAFFVSSPTARPVQMVRMSSELWDANLRAAQAALRSRPTPDIKSPNARATATPSDTRVQPPEEEAKKPEPKAEEKRLRGQVVEVPPTADSSPNPDAKYLSKYNSHVEKESVARMEDRDPSRRRVTRRLQTRHQPTPAPDAIPTPGLTVKGHGGQEDHGDSKPNSEAGKSKLVIKVPNVESREALDLKLIDGPGLQQGLKSRMATEALRGNADKLELRLGEDPDGTTGGGEPTKRGDENGVDRPPLPSLSGKVPTLGTVADMSGSPSRDHVDGVPEGEGTFLNTKEFKYATFFYRVRDSVASQWEDLAWREFRRRDPTGNIYGVKDRATLLEIRLTRDGKLDHVQVAATSGVDFLDQVAMQAFQMAQPFPNPPAGIADEDGAIRFNFQFIVTMHPRSPFNVFNFQ